MSVNFSNVHYVYNKKSPLEFEALSGIDLSIEKGSFTAIVGRTGCGKSTLIQHINALLHPTSGEVEVLGFHNTPKKKGRSKNVKELRRHVGVVFQFPEAQLFEDTVEKDVAYGPKNFGLKNEEALQKAHESLKAVGLDESFYERSPFELSGGEKRRVAIAGILAIGPEILVVDEPTAGLDPLGGKEMMDLFEMVHRQGTTIILVTHDMGLVLNYADKVVVMDNGKIVEITDPVSLFSEDIEAYSLESPMVYKFVKDLFKKGIELDFQKIRDVDSLADEIIRVKGGSR